MSILHEISRFVKPQNLMAMILIFIVVTFLNIAALYASSEHSGYRASNEPQTMRRESAIEGEILEGRSIIVNVPRLRGGNETMVVMV